MLPSGKKAKLQGLASDVLSSVTLSWKVVVAGDAVGVAVVVWVLGLVPGAVLVPAGVVVEVAVVVVVALGFNDKLGVSPAGALLWLAGADASAPPPQATTPTTTKAVKAKMQLLPSNQLL
jgi:hypothetical protein